MLVREIVYEWRRVNAAYFKEALRPPVLAFSISNARLGQWNGATRTLEISRTLVLAHPWGAVVEVAVSPHNRRRVTIDVGQGTPVPARQTASPAGW